MKLDKSTLLDSSGLIDKSTVSGWVAEASFEDLPINCRLENYISSVECHSVESGSSDSSSSDSPANNCSISISLPFPANNLKAALASSVEKLILSRHSELSSVSVKIESRIAAYETKAGIPPVEGVKNIIAVASGKGGVGKSTTSVNLALALANEGAKVGLVDADIYGPSLPIMLGLKDSKAETQQNKRIVALEAHGIQVMSMGFLVGQQEAAVWRGPVAASAFQTFVRNTNWHDLDYLIVDLPPGTGDIQLTMSQKIPVTAALVVTTPQDLALADAQKAVSMFEKVKIPVIGLVENMATHVCSVCGHEEAIFGEGGGELMAQNYQVPLLGQLPLDINIRRAMDQGTPCLVESPNSAISHSYKKIARGLACNLAALATNYARTSEVISVSHVTDC